MKPCEKLLIQSLLMWVAAIAVIVSGGLVEGTIIAVGGALTGAIRIAVGAITHDAQPISEGD